MTTLRNRFEQLDVKLLVDYNIEWTTHVVSRKRNTAKGLQALINGKYIVTESLLDALTSATEPPPGEDDSGCSLLEQNFDANWPDELQHLPPRGSEPVQHLDQIYAPDPERKELFDGYTFIFYDKTQYSNLLAPITNGCGKAMLYDVQPEKTQVDDFVRYVKELAGEKGLGRFEDGSEGKGVVLVRYLPAKGDIVLWYTEFLTAVSLRLDHRPIEQNEFLEAILIRDASKLRRPLEVESSSEALEHQTQEQSCPAPVAESSSNSGSSASLALAENSQESQPAPRRGAARRPVKRRFAGFDDDEDIDMDDIPLAPAPVSAPVPAPGRNLSPDEESGLFVSQEQDTIMNHGRPNGNSISQKKRAASPLPEDDLMDGMAPAVARFKRQRLEHNGGFASPSPEPEVKTEPVEPAPQAGKKKKSKEMDVLAMVAKNRAEEEARVRAEKEDLANLPDDVDLAEIRRLNIVEEMEIHVPQPGQRTREQDVADGRWDPKWNGLKNFKRFRPRGEVLGRQPARIIIALTEVKKKEFGVGDNYWLEDEESQRKKTSQSSLISTHEERKPIPTPTPIEPSPRKRPVAARIIASDSSDVEDDEDDSEMVPEPAPQSRTRAASGRAAAVVAESQRNVRSQSSVSISQTSKRPAPESGSTTRSEPPAKRQRPAPPKLTEIADSDDSEDELKFRFGKRR